MAKIKKKKKKRVGTYNPKQSGGNIQGTIPNLTGETITKKGILGLSRVPARNGKEGLLSEDSCVTEVRKQRGKEQLPKSSWIRSCK